MSQSKKLPPEFLALLKNVKGKRSRVVVEHILEHDFITAEDLETIYGYKHPPRAIRDVREQGISLEMFRIKNSQGRNIAAYRFGDTTVTGAGRIGGRKQIPKWVKQALLAEGAKCAICLQTYAEPHLQVDHRIPYEVAGDAEQEISPQMYLLLCGSCNRAKSWSCEHCANWMEQQNPALCAKCYWAVPQVYDHTALQSIRRLDIVWQGNEVDVYEYLQRQARENNEPLPDFVKSILKRQKP